MAGRGSRSSHFSAKGPLLSAVLAPTVLGGAGLGVGALADKYLNDDPDPEMKNKWKKRLGFGGLGAGLVLDGIYNWPPYTAVEETTKRSESIALLKKAYFDYYTQPDDIPVHYSANMLYEDPVMDPMQKSRAIGYLYSANQNTSKPGLISWGDVSRAAIGAGVGYGAATLFGKVLGGVMALPSSTQKKLQTAGMVGGMLVNTGALS